MYDECRQPHTHTHTHTHIIFLNFGSHLFLKIEIFNYACTNLCQFSGSSRCSDGW